MGELADKPILVVVPEYCKGAVLNISATNVG